MSIRHKLWISPVFHVRFARTRHRDFISARSLAKDAKYAIFDIFWFRKISDWLCSYFKGFFKRAITDKEEKNIEFICNSGGNCQINIRNRNSCRKCRFDACIQAGMGLRSKISLKWRDALHFWLNKILSR